jgi:hypothetical protein
MRLRTLPECPLWPEDAPPHGFIAEAKALIVWLVRLRFFWLAIGMFAGAFMGSLLS